MKTYYLFIIILLFLIVYLGCAGKSEQQNVLVVGIESNPTNLDPRLATDVASARVIDLVYNGLMKLNEADEFVPDLAVSVENPDERTYLFKLRENVQFHNGILLNSEDVKYTFDSILDPEFPSPKKESYRCINKIETPDDKTVVFHLAEPFAPFITNMTLGIVSKTFAEKEENNLSRNPMGTGPYKFKTWSTDQMIELSAFDNCFSEKPLLAGIIYKIIPDNTVRILELIKGSVDFVQNSLPLEMLPNLEKNPKLKIMRVPGTVFTYLGFNLEDPVLKHLKVRQAIALAIDRESLIKHLLLGTAQLADSLLPTTHWAYEAEVEKYTFNPEQAKKLLDEAGFPDPDQDGPQSRFELLYKTSQNPARLQICAAIAEQLNQVGIKVEIRSYEWGTFYDDIKSGNFQIFTLDWVGVTDPDIYYRLFHSKSVPPEGANRGHYTNPVVDRLLDLGRTTLDKAERKACYSQIQKILSRELPYVWLWHADNIAVMNKHLQGYQIYPAGNFIPLRKVWFSKPTANDE